MAQQGDSSSLSTGISVAVAVGVGIGLSRVLEPAWGLWGFLVAMVVAAVVAMGVGALLSRREGP